MENIFMKLVTMSIPTGWIILVILLLRVLLKRIPRNVFCILWALAAIRLICPVSFESAWSLIPNAEAMYPGVNLFYQKVNTPITDNTDINLTSILSDNKNSTTKQTIFPTYAEAPKTKDTISTNLTQYVILAATIIWIAGILLFILYTWANLFKIHRRINECIILQDNILLCDHISTPFIWGIFHPKIILPSSTKEQHIKHVLAHEKAHIARHDYWWKPLGFVLLIIYWFNPLIWVAYKFFCRDIELACDEKVIKNYDNTNKKSYSLALLNCSAQQNEISAYPLAFGEIGVKERIKAIMKYKKPAFGIIFIATIICIALPICFLTDPKKTHTVNANMAKLKNPSDITYYKGSETRGDITKIESEASKQAEKHISSDSMKYITILKNSSDITYYKGGETRGYITKLGKDTITVDLQNWITEEDEEWKPEYDKVVGFKVVDVPGENVTLQLSKNCTFHILEHHQGPIIKLNHKKFQKYYHECQEEDYSVLWFLTFENNQITSIHEQYRP